MGLLERDEAAGELEEGEVVLVFLAPADEDAAVSVQPGVGCFDDPAAGAPAGLLELEFDLFAARPDVRRVAVLEREGVHRRRVVGAVEAEALRLCRGRRRPLDRNAVQGRLEERLVVAVRTVVRQPDRDPRSLAENRTFRPF